MVLPLIFDSFEVAVAMVLVPSQVRPDTYAVGFIDGENCDVVGKALLRATNAANPVFAEETAIITSDVLARTV